MLYARKELQIQVRVRSNKGKLNAYRPVKHVREDCKKEVARRMLPVSSMEVSGTPSKRRYSRCANESQMETPAKRKRNARTGPVQPNKDMADTKPFGSHVGFSPKHSYTRRNIKEIEKCQHFSPYLLHRDSLMRFARVELGIEVREKSSSGKISTCFRCKVRY